MFSGHQKSDVAIVKTPCVAAWCIIVAHFLGNDNFAKARVMGLVQNIPVVAAWCISVAHFLVQYVNLAGCVVLVVGLWQLVAPGPQSHTAPLSPALRAPQDELALLVGGTTSYYPGHLDTGRGPVCASAVWFYRNKDCGCTKPAIGGADS